MSEGRQSWKPGTMVYPVPAALVSCGSHKDNRNLLTVAWTGTVCTDPPMLYISVRPSRHSYNIIKEEGEFTLCLSTAEMSRATDWCGVRSGRDYDKWLETGLTAIPGEKVSCAYVGESPLCIECRVKTVIPLGSHDIFLADVVNVIADTRYIDPQTGGFDLASAGLMAWSHGHYHELGKAIGKFGFSVEKESRAGGRGSSRTKKK